MIIEKDTKIVYSGMELRVKETKDYEDTDLVELYVFRDSEEKPIYAFSADFILQNKLD